MTAQRRRVVLASFGSHGDLHPFIAIALELRRRGYAPVIAAAPRYSQLVASTGIDFFPSGPAPADYESVLKLSGAEIYRRMCFDAAFMIAGLIDPFLRRWYDDAVKVLAGAEFLIAHPLSLGARLAAEKMGIPQLRVALAPYGLMSAEDLPIWFDSPLLSRVVRRLGGVARQWFAHRLRHSTMCLIQSYYLLRKEVGLGATEANPLHGITHDNEISIGLFSRRLMNPKIESNGTALLAGFAYFEGVETETKLSSELRDFISGTVRPIVFTLGTAGLYDVDRFVAAVRGAIGALGLRGAILLGDLGRDRFQHLNSDSLFVSNYAPYSKVFTKAEAVVHVAGIGTCAQAMRAGVPQLLLPAIVDQPDTADRLERLGVAKVLPMRKLSAATLTAGLESLLRDAGTRQRARTLAAVMVNEPDGAKICVDLIDARLRGTA